MKSSEERRESKVQLSFDLHSTFERRESEIQFYLLDENLYKGCFTNGITTFRGFPDDNTILK